MPIDLLERSIILTNFDTEFMCPRWLRAHPPLAIENDESGLTWSLSEDSLRMYHTASGGISATHALPESPPDAPMQLIARGGHTFALWGEAILSYGPARPIRIEKMHRPVRQLAVTQPMTLWRVAVAMSEGGMVLWEVGNNKPFGDGLFDPLITFTRGGMLVAVDRRQGRVYETRSGDVRKRGEFSPSGSVLAVTHTTHSDEFATFTEDGAVTVYKLPS